MLIEEVEKRTQIRWPQTNIWPEGRSPVILVGTAAQLAGFAGPEQSTSRTPGGAEGYRLTAGESDERMVVSITGNDSRGVLFGVGRLLRELRMKPRGVELPAKLNIVTAPRYPLRGHQLGYRPKDRKSVV